MKKEEINKGVKIKEYFSDLLLIDRSFVIEGDRISRINVFLIIVDFNSKYLVL